MDSLYPVSAYGDLSNMVWASVMDRARACFRQAAAEKAALDSPAAVKAWQARLRQAFLAAVGGLPEPVGDLAPVWGERRERAGYAVQNVLFAAAPDVVVTATVWWPTGWSGRRPAVLFPCGHHEDPREVAEYQAVCATFALNGYVTLAYDPPGQGERKLCWDAALGRSFAGTGSAEHEHCGRQCELVGHNIARYFVRDGRRAVDLLLSLPAVDGTRIAVTGNSGGGTQTSYLMLADERLACGLPATFTTDRQTYMGRTHWHDAEQNLTGAIAAGLDYEDFLACFAPRPAAIGAVTWDFFPVEGTRRAFERLQHVYRLLGAAERVALFEGETGHSYHPQLRQQAVEWFNRWLQPEATFRPLVDFVPEAAEAQRNTAAGQVSLALPGRLGVFDETAGAVAAAAATRQVPPAGELAARLGLPLRPAADRLNPRMLAQVAADGLTCEKLFLIAEHGHEPDVLSIVPLLRIAPPAPARAVLWAGDGGVAGLDAAGEAGLRDLARQGVAVYLAEPRGLGETKSRSLAAPQAPEWLTETWLSQHFRMLGTSLGALRAYDLLCAAAYVRQREPGRPLGLWGEGLVGWSVVLAAALDRGFDRVQLADLRPSLDEYATTWRLSPPEAYTVPGLLTMGDLPDLLAAAGPDVLLTTPRDPLGHELDAAAWQERYAARWSVVPRLAWGEPADSLRFWTAAPSA